MMRSPPRSPSTNTVTVFRLASSTMVCGTEVPLIAMAFLKSCFSRLRTSALPSTMMISSESSIIGPAASRSLPYSRISLTRTEYATSSANSWESGMMSSTMVLSSSLARSTTKRRLEIRTSSIRDPELCIAGADALDDLQGSSHNAGLGLVQGRGDDDLPLGLPAPGLDVHFYPADPSGALELAQLQLRAEQALGLAENRADDIRPVNNAVDLDAGMNDVF